MAVPNRFILRTRFLLIDYKDTEISSFFFSEPNSSLNAAWFSNVVALKHSPQHAKKSIQSIPFDMYKIYVWLTKCSCSPFFQRFIVFAFVLCFLYCYAQLETDTSIFNRCVPFCFNCILLIFCVWESMQTGELHKIQTSGKKVPKMHHSTGFGGPGHIPKSDYFFVCLPVSSISFVCPSFAKNETNTNEMFRFVQKNRIKNE